MKLNYWKIIFNSYPPPPIHIAAGGGERCWGSNEACSAGQTVGEAVVRGMWEVSWGAIGNKAVGASGGQAV